MSEIEKIIEINAGNIAEEHICCAISDKKCLQGYQSKKDLMSAQFASGYRFRRLNVRGKVFLDYAPSEISWLPVEAPDYFVLGCFWVSGRYKGNGWGKQLLEDCIAEARSQGKSGLVSLAGKSKKPFLSDKKFLKSFGFQVCDSAAPFFELLYLPLREDAVIPQFLPHVKEPQIDEPGLVFYYSSWCPYTLHYIDEMRAYAEENQIPFSAHYLENREQARQAPSPFPIWTVYYQGQFLTHEILTKPRLEKLLAKQ